MNERSLRVLEFTKIRAQLAQYCVSDMGKALCEALNPSNRIEDVLRMQQETDEAHSLLAYLGGTPMIPFSDVHAHCILLKSVPRFRRARCWISASAFGPPERRGMRL